MRDDRFCERCGIDLGLHGTDDPGTWDCEYAARKADLLAEMAAAFGVRHG